MSIRKILTSLDKAWERDDILLDIKNGLSSDEIVDDFLEKNEVVIKELNSLLRPENIALLNQVEQLSTCESKLINKIKNLNYSENKYRHKTNEEEILLPNSVSSSRISSFMINWSNKFIIIALITISAIALSKQAWA